MVMAMMATCRGGRMLIDGETLASSTNFCRITWKKIGLARSIHSMYETEHTSAEHIASSI